MTGVREFTSSDIPQVAELHRAVMETGPVMTPVMLERYGEWLSSVFLDNPMRAHGSPGLVYEDGGEILGFLGIVARQVAIGDHVFRAAVGSNFCVQPTRRGRMGLQLARAYLSCSGELAFIDELTDRTRTIWDYLGMMPMPQSVRWSLPLQPSAHVMSVVESHIPRPARAAARPMARLADRVASSVPRSPFLYRTPDLTGTSLSGEELGPLLMEFGPADWLRPVTTDGSTAWLVARARSLTQHGTLKVVALNDPAGELVGWYVYYAIKDRPSEVLQLVAAPGMADKVLDHLAADARAHGAVSLTGALDLTFLSALSAHWAMINPAPRPTRWLLVRSERKEILEAYWRGRVLLSRLDGEWCQQFHKTA